MEHNKNFKLGADQIKDLIPRMGGCMATDKITVNGEPVKYMYRQEPVNNIDSGWVFLSGTETQEYLDDAVNTMIYDVNTIANYDKAIIPYLNLPIGSDLERIEGTDTFENYAG
ncbi:DUF2185 domain-containing protein [Pedobacter miscanthi]|uniref:DUF2185 domain-containing protein n=1 Tax=Pedobacter miscanthi TaxID=2259170 RepID=A0A366KM87_9SPHI|nr:DUF2185 domain-containing protein [Pedobacter miscanthi]RBQ02796.1 DUF2185 domain-containing protein [Pedobacter miscanthi]